MDRPLSDEQLDRAVIRILAEQGAEIEAAGITPAGAVARVGSRPIIARGPRLVTRFHTMNTTLKVAAVAVLALAVGIGVVQFRPSTYYGGADPTLSASSSLLVWTPASIEQDWPAPVREEPVGEPVVIQVADGYLDPQGDIESSDMPWIDILRVGSHAGGYRTAGFDLGGALPSEFVVPGDPWVAYGLVFDTDLDGVADVRLGLDRVPVDLTPWGGAPGDTNDTNDTDVRAWRTDLRTGGTEVGDATDQVCDCVYPGTLADMGGGQPRARFYPYPYDDGPPFRFGEIPGHFYAWASVIQDGRVVATDYAPDVGWLDVGVRMPSSATGVPVASPSPPDQRTASPAP